MNVHVLGLESSYFKSWFGAAPLTYLQTGGELATTVTYLQTGGELATTVTYLQTGLS